MIDLFDLREAYKNNELCAYVHKGIIYIGDTTCIVSIGEAKTKIQFEEWEENKIKEYINGE